MAHNADRMPPKSPIHDFELPAEIRDDPRIHEIPSEPVIDTRRPFPLPTEVRVLYEEYIKGRQADASAPVEAPQSTEQ